MAKQYTEHYDLCQWAAEDAFHRTEFNEDNAKIDAALDRAQRSAQRALDTLVPVSQNVYSLFLREYYEGRYTGDKKAMVFDGFLDGSQIESLSDGLVRSKAGHFLFLDGIGTPNQDVNFGSAYPVTLAAGQSLEVRWTCNRVGWAGAVRVIMSGTATMRFTSASGDLDKQMEKYSFGSGMEEVAYPFGVDLDPGETYIFRITAKTQVTLGRKYGTADEPPFGARVEISDPAVIPSGVLVSKPYRLGASFSQARAFVRYYMGPPPVLSLLDEDGMSYPMTRLKNYAAVTMGGERCSEASYLLPELPPGGQQLRLRLEAEIYSEVNLRIFDYGIIAI